MNKPPVVKPTSDYAVYRGDEFLCWGSVTHCAKVMGLSIARIYSLHTLSKAEDWEEPTQRGIRYTVIKIEEEDDE